MAADSPEFINSALKVYHAEVHRAIKAQEVQLGQLTSAHDQLKQTFQTVHELPRKLRHEVMVPLGRHAFFPGHLTRTNEIMVHLGDQYYVEVTASAACGILQRKLAVLADGVSKAEQQLHALKARLDVTQSSLKDESSGEDAIEIRSTLEESEALLATASKSKQAAAAAAAQQQQQRPVSRVKAAAGYSYTPLAMPDDQVSQQHDLDPEDAALQARLDELLWLEEQQQQQDAADLQQQEGLATIQEGEEGEAEYVGNGPAAAGAAGSAPAAAGPTRLSAVQHLQQLEAEADSDDEDHYQQRAPAQAAAAAAASSSGSGGLVGQVLERLPELKQPQQQQQPHAAVRGSASMPATAGKAGSSALGLKSALKKGFFNSPAPKPSSSSSSSRGVAISPSSSSSSTATKGQSSAFTGTVVERPAPVSAVSAAPATAAPIGAVVERNTAVDVAPPAAATVAGMSGASASSSSRPSKFKLRKMGLEPAEQ